MFKNLFLYYYLIIVNKSLTLNPNYLPQTTISHFKLNIDNKVLNEYNMFILY